MILAVAILGVTLALLGLLAASGRVIGWLMAAAVMAGLLHPLVDALNRWLPRGVALATVVIGTLALAAVVAYGTVDEIVDQTRNLQRAAPEAARDLERSERWGDAARELELAKRTEEFVDDVPERLRGGTPQEALRSAANRSVAFLATGVLTIFFLLHGLRISRSAAEQITDPRRRLLVVQVGGAAYRRTWRYLMGRVLMALAAGLFGYLVASLADVPGAVVLGLWCALWDLVPLLGFVIGSVPIIVLAAVQEGEKGLIVAGVIVAYQLFEALLLQRRAERGAIRLGPFLTVAGGLVGLELYGLGGALLAIVVLAGVVGVAEELEERREEQAEATATASSA